MKQTQYLVLGLSLLALGCGSGQEKLDLSISRLETPDNELAMVQTTYWNDELIGTAFLDRQNRVREQFDFGRSNGKTIHQYVGNNRVGSIAYRHGDSDGEGCRGIALFRYTYDQRGTLVREVQVRHFLCGTEKMGPANEITIGYRYSPTGDTLRTITEVPTPGQPHSYTHINVDRWERNARGQVDRQYVLNAIRDCRGGVITTDTNTNYSRRFAYDSAGKLIRVWYEYIYLGKFYHLSTGRPDTTYIRYDAANRRTHEVMRYTTDLRNKREPDMTGLSTLQKQDAAQAKLRFLNGNSGSDGNYTATIRHSYEPYDPVKHRPLNVPRWSSSWIH